MSFMNSAYVPSPRRMWVIARTTFTQLLRMKVFLFLIIFCLISLLIAGIRPEYYLGPETHGVYALNLLKNSSFGAIRMFGLIFCIMATALIIPKDTEDRILYTILCKPVHRIDYLVGKALGVLLLAVLAVCIMHAFSSVLLWMRTDTIMAEQKEALLAAGNSMENVLPYLDQIRQEGVTWNYHAGVLVLLMECAVLTSLTLLFSCLTGGTLISALLAFCVYFIGIFQAQAKIMWLGASGDGVGFWEKMSSQLFTLIFPNFGIYSISDSAVNGQLIPYSILWQLALITLAYFIFHSMLSAWIFRKKEF